MGGVFSLLIISAYALAVPHLAQAAPFATAGQFDQVTTIVAPKMRLQFVQSVKFKDGDIRLDKTDLAQVIPVTQIETPSTIYFYSSVAGTGEKSAVTEKMLPLLERMDSDTKSKLKGASKVGTETFEGYSCDLYKTTDSASREQVEFWVSKDPAFPFTIKTVATDKLLDKVTTVELENIGLNVKLDDSLFQVPASIKIVPASSQTKDAAPSASAAGASATDTNSKP